MIPYLIYIAKAAVTLTLLYSLYGICLRRESFHSLNRIVLILILIISVTLPFFHIETSLPSLFSWVKQPDSIIITQMENLPLTEDATFRETDTAETDITQSPLHPINGVKVLFLLYIVGAIFFALRYLSAILRTVRIIRQARPTDRKGNGIGQLLVTHELDSTCSWLHWVILVPADIDNKSIITHEQVHIRLGHSYDKMFCELVVRLLWFVPFGWMLREDLSDTHEYEADRSVLKAGFDIKEYCLLLIHRATHTHKIPVVNAFNESKIKQRMTRMFQPPSPRLSVLKVLYLFPLAAMAMIAVAEPKQQMTEESLLTPTSDNEEVLIFRDKADGHIRLNTHNASDDKEPLIVVDGKIIEINPLDYKDSTNVDLAEVIGIHPEIINSITVLKGSTGEAIWGRRGVNGVIEIETKRPVDDDPNHEVFIIAEEPAEFVGGEAAMMRYLSHHLQYPSLAIEHGVQGRVHVEFIVEKDGSISDVKAALMKNADKGGIITITAYQSKQNPPKATNTQTPPYVEEILKASVVAVIRNMPNWKPAHQRGQAVRMKMLLPILYKL